MQQNDTGLVKYDSSPPLEDGAYPELPCGQSIEALRSTSDFDRVTHQGKAIFIQLCKLFDDAAGTIDDRLKNEELLRVARPLMTEIVGPLLEHGSNDADTICCVLSFLAAVTMLAEMCSLPTGLRELGARSDETGVVLDLMRQATERLLDDPSHPEARRLASVAVVRTRVLAGYVANALRLPPPSALSGNGRGALLGAGVLGTAATGAVLGTPFGPVGSAVGAVAGALVGGAAVGLMAYRSS